MKAVGIILVMIVLSVLFAKIYLPLMYDKPIHDKAQRAIIMGRSIS